MNGVEIYKILEELNLENGSNYKISVLEKHKDNKLLQRVLKMAYDKVAFTYHISMKNIAYNKRTIDQSLEDALDVLEHCLHSRRYTGNKAIELLSYTLGSISNENADIIIKIINRDLRINMGRSNINKVFKDLITKPAYCRCDIFTTDKPELKDGKTVLDKKGLPKIKKGTARNISLVVDEYLDGLELLPKEMLEPCVIDNIQKAIDKLEPKAIVQLKADGSFLNIKKSSNLVNKHKTFIEESGVTTTDGINEYVFDSLQYLKENKNLIGTQILGEILNHNLDSKDFIERELEYQIYGVFRDGVYLGKLSDF